MVMLYPVQDCGDREIMANEKDGSTVFGQGQEPLKEQILRNVGQQWFRCPGEAMLSDNVIISTGGFGLILCDVFLVVAGPKTGDRVVKAVKSQKLEVYREGPS